MEAAHKNEPGRIQGWEQYPEAQLLSSLELVKWLLAQFPNIKWILGHDDVAPSRKSDPGPAFPIERFQALLQQGSSMPDRDGVTGEGANFSTRGRTHTVVAGDTLSSIAREHDITLDALRAANGGASDMIKPGEVLLLPEDVR